MELKPIGVVRSEIKAKENMPVQGVNAEIDIFEEYSEALMGIDGNTHIILLCWLHEADRTVLKAVPRKISESLPEQGVFSLRSPARPNPVSVTVAKIYRRYGRHLFLIRRGCHRRHSGHRHQAIPGGMGLHFFGEEPRPDPEDQKDDAAGL